MSFDSMPPPPPPPASRDLLPRSRREQSDDASPPPRPQREQIKDDSLPPPPSIRVRPPLPPGGVGAPEAAVVAQEVAPPAAAAAVPPAPQNFGDCEDLLLEIEVGDVERDWSRPAASVEPWEGAEAGEGGRGKAGGRVGGLAESSSLPEASTRAAVAVAGEEEGGGRGGDATWEVTAVEKKEASLVTRSADESLRERLARLESRQNRQGSGGVRAASPRASFAERRQLLRGPGSWTSGVGEGGAGGAGGGPGGGLKLSIAALRGGSGGGSCLGSPSSNMVVTQEALGNLSNHMASLRGSGQMTEGNRANRRESISRRLSRGASVGVGHLVPKGATVDVSAVDVRAGAGEAADAAAEAMADPAAADVSGNRVRAFSRRLSNRRKASREAAAAAAAAATAAVVDCKEELAARDIVLYDGIAELGKSSGARRLRDGPDPYAHPPGLLTGAVRDAMEAGADRGEEEYGEEEEEVEAARESRVSSSGASSLAESRRSEVWAVGSDAGMERNVGRGGFFAQGPPSARGGNRGFSPRATPVRTRGVMWLTMTQGTVGVLIFFFFEDRVILRSGCRIF